MMLDLHIEGAAPVTLLVRDESRSTRSTSVNKDDGDLDLDEAETENSSSAGGGVINVQPRLSRMPTSSVEESDTTTTAEMRTIPRKKASSLALQIVDSEDATANEPLTLAEEMASFEYIDELAASVTSSSSISDFDVWSPKADDAASASPGIDASVESKMATAGAAEKCSTLKDRFLLQIQENLLNIPARRASAESLTSNLMITPPKESIPTSFSVTNELNKVDTDPESIPELPPKRQRNLGTRQSKLVRQSKVDVESSK